MPKAITNKWFASKGEHYRSAQCEYKPNNHHFKLNLGWLRIGKTPPATTDKD